MLLVEPYDKQQSFADLSAVLLAQFVRTLTSCLTDENQKQRSMHILFSLSTEAQHPRVDVSSAIQAFLDDLLRMQGFTARTSRILGQLIPVTGIGLDRIPAEATLHQGC